MLKQERPTLNEIQKPFKNNNNENSNNRYSQQQSCKTFAGLVTATTYTHA